MKNARSGTAKARGPANQKISADAAYSLDEFRRLARLGNVAMRRARANGLPVRRVGRMAYVVGAEWISWLQSRPSQRPSGSNGSHHRIDTNLPGGRGR